MIEFFLKRRVLTTLITLLIAALGAWQFLRMPREAFPDVKFDIVIVSTVYVGASPEEVDRFITQPVEKQIKTVNHIDRVESYSLENYSTIVVRLEEGLNKQETSRAVTDIQKAVASLEYLPEQVRAPLVTEMTSDRPLITLSVAGGDDLSRDRMTERLRDLIEDLPEVSKVDSPGDLVKEIWVEAIAAKLEQYRLTVGEIANAIKSENINIPAGFINAGDKEFAVRTISSLGGEQDIARVILRSNDERGFIRVSDVARVSETFAEQRVLERSGGLAAINLQVRKSRGADAIELADAIKKIRDDFEAEAAHEGLKLMISDDISFFIKRRLNVMKSNMLQGGFLILAALFIFLDWRIALVASAGVPISFATAMIAGAPLGLTINLLSLLAFIIVLGMLDDDSVAVADNIYRHLEMGKPPLQAALDGAREILLPVLGSVAATGAAFIPFALTSGIMGKFLFMIPVIVILCFLASVFEAFCILPAHILELLHLGRPIQKKSEGRWYTAIIERYKMALAWCIDHRYRFLGLAAGVILATAAAAHWRLKIVMFPEGMIDQFFIQIQTPEGSSLQTTEKTVRQVESIVLGLAPMELETITSSVGQAGYEESIQQGTHHGQIRVFLAPQENRKRTANEIIAEIKPKIETLPGLAKLTFDKLHSGPPVGRAVQVRIRGNEIGKINEISRRIQEILKSLPGVSDVKDNAGSGKNELLVRINPEQAAFAGVPATQVARHILHTFEGGEVTKIRQADEEVVVKVRLSNEYRTGARALEDLLVLNNRSQQVRLAPLIKIERQKSPPYIERYNYKRAIAVTADVDNKNATSHQANEKVRQAFAAMAKEFPGYDLVFGGEEEMTEKSISSLKRGFIVALFLDLIILAALFNSYVQPFIIMLTIPIGLIGVSWALMLHGEPASFMALLGAVAMTGVVINNSIVLIDFINQRRREGASLREAAIDAGATRLRPIFASSITTLLGLFPSAYGFGGYEPFVAPMCLALAWGLTLAMPLTLFAIPMAALIADDAGRWLRRRFA